MSATCGCSPSGQVTTRRGLFATCSCRHVCTVLCRFISSCARPRTGKCAGLHRLPCRPSNIGRLCALRCRCSEHWVSKGPYPISKWSPPTVTRASTAVPAGRSAARIHKHCRGCPAGALGRPQPAVPVLAAARPGMGHGPWPLPERSHPPGHGRLPHLGRRWQRGVILLQQAQVSQAALAFLFHPFGKPLALACIIQRAGAQQVVGRAIAYKAQGRL